MRSVKDISVFNNRGSALILVVVLTSLLAMVGAMFLLQSRVGSSGSASVATERELDAAVNSVIATISDELVRDVPGVVSGDPNADYFDYPGDNDMWLANLEPTVDFNGTAESGNDFVYWRQISDVYRDSVSGIGILHTISAATSAGNAEWRDVTGGVYGRLVSSWLRPVIVSPDEPIGMIKDRSNQIPDIYYYGPADADGDGVADSRWVPVGGVQSRKGEKVYAAIRVVDNGGMLNVNTAGYFDPNEMEERSLCDGSSQTQVNLAFLSSRGLSNDSIVDEAEDLHLLRCDSNDNISLGDYVDDVVWGYDWTGWDYTPFDISDELKLRNRYILNDNKFTSRIEDLWNYAYDGGLKTEVESLSDPCSNWPYRANFDYVNSSNYDKYDFRHVGTVHNMDRVIRPDGVKMVNANWGSVDALYGAIRAAGFDDANAAQLAVNMRDCADEDNVVSVIGEYYGFERPYICISEVVVKLRKTTDPGDPVRERMSFGLELVKRHRGENNDNWRVIIEGTTDLPGPIDVSDYGKDNSKYQVILFQDPCVPLEDDVAFTDPPEDGETNVDANNVTLSWEDSWRMEMNDVNVLGYDLYFGTDKIAVGNADTSSGEYITPRSFATSYKPGILANNTWHYWRVDDVVEERDPNDPNNFVENIHEGPVWSFQTGNPHKEVMDVNEGFALFDEDSRIVLQREIGGEYREVDSILLSEADWLFDAATGVLVDDNRSYKRDIRYRRCVRHLWDNDAIERWPTTLGHGNGYDYPHDDYKLAIHLSDFENIGEIGKVFRVNGYWGIGPLSREYADVGPAVRLNVADPAFQPLFKYLTVMDPNRHSGNLPGEMRVKGRININTAPWYVIAQLPWVSQRRGGGFNNKLARSIVAYRDRWNLSAEGGGNFKNEDNYWEGFGYTSTGELNRVNLGTDSAYRMNYYGTDSDDQLGFPDLSTNSRTRKDGMVDDFEERDLIFSRISDLVTVRSDVYTAYILVRIGRDGPQRRVMAILDRSEVKNAGGKVKVLSLHRVPDSR